MRGMNGKTERLVDEGENRRLGPMYVQLNNRLNNCCRDEVV